MHTILLICTANCEYDLFLKRYASSFKIYARLLRYMHQVLKFMLKLNVI